MKTYAIYFSGAGAARNRMLIESTCPVSCLNSFHRLMQVTRKVKPEDYAVVGLYDYYNNDATGNGRGDWIESELDLPKSPTPVLEKKETKEEPQEVMGFYGEVKTPS